MLTMFPIQDTNGELNGPLATEAVWEFAQRVNPKTTGGTPPQKRKTDRQTQPLFFCGSFRETTNDAHATSELITKNGGGAQPAYDLTMAHVTAKTQ